jgi:hypothetical protein
MMVGSQITGGPLLRGHVKPRDNILAGAAYIHEMHDRYGLPGFLAAYTKVLRRIGTRSTAAHQGHIAGRSAG